MASFGSAQVAAVRVGCRAGTEVQAIVSGLFTSAFALGNFCGPTISVTRWGRGEGGNPNIFNKLTAKLAFFTQQFIRFLLLIIQYLCYGPKLF